MFPPVSASRLTGGISSVGEGDLTDHGTLRQAFFFIFYLALAMPLGSFDVGRECIINVSTCERYTINCGTPSIQNAHIDLAEVARCTLLVNCSTDLDWCFCRSSRCIS